MAATVAIGAFATFQTGADSGDRQFRSRRHASSHGSHVALSRVARRAPPLLR